MSTTTKRPGEDRSARGRDYAAQVADGMARLRRRKNYDPLLNLAIRRAAIGVLRYSDGARELERACKAILELERRAQRRSLERAAAALRSADGGPGIGRPIIRTAQIVAAAEALAEAAAAEQVREVKAWREDGRRPMGVL